jgi:hypothetical protein
LFDPAPAITGTRPGGGLDHRLDDLLVFLVAQRRAFAGGADGDQAVAALGDLPFDQRLERLEIDRAVAERGDQGRHRTAEHVQP